MNLEATKKKNNEHTPKKRDWVNILLWLLIVILVGITAIGNIYLFVGLSFIVKILIVVGLLAAAFGLAAITKQGKTAREFLKESRIELKKVVWPTRQETTQTTFIVIAVTVVVSLILWAFDSIIVVLLNFLTRIGF